MTFDKLVKEQIYQKIDRNIYNYKFDFINGFTYFKACDWKWMGIVDILYLDNGTEEVAVTLEASDLPNWDYMIEVNFPVVKSLKLQNLHWFTGTFKEANADFATRDNDERNKLPMMWLSFTPTPKTIEKDNLSVVGYEHTLTIFFCASAYFTDFLTENHMRTRIDYLSKYVDSFVSAIEKNKKYFQSDNGVENTRYYYPKFGNLGANGGTIIDSQLSAIELKLTLKEKRSCEC